MGTRPRSYVPGSFPPRRAATRGCRVPWRVRLQDGGRRLLRRLSECPGSCGAAHDAQMFLLSEEWEETGPLKVRMALHTGTAEERDGDYFGLTINRVARLLSAGHGGQILLSLTTQELV